MLLAGLGGAIFFLVYAFYTTKYFAPVILVPAANNQIIKATPPFAQPIYGFPIRLKIPAINIDAAFKNVGITPGGAMAMPKNINEIGWYDLGSRPGDIGSAVIAGHYGYQNGEAAAFNNIYKLAIGDKIIVTDSKGNDIIFIVSDTKSFDPKADTSNVFISSDGKSHLNLITCEGAWNKTTRSYSSRLVIFADKE